MTRFNSKRKDSKDKERERKQSKKKENRRTSERVKCFKNRGWSNIECNGENKCRLMWITLSRL